MSLDSLIVYESKYPKVRIGSENDGGYVMVDNLDYDCIISCGIADDINFEKEIMNKYTSIPCYCYDGTIEKLPEESDRMIFIKKNIASYESDRTTTLLDIFEKYNNILLKMDIETFEYRWIDMMPLDKLYKIKQIVIEFHFPFTDTFFPHLDVPLPVNNKMGVLEKLSKTHILVHLHANNCCGTTIYQEIIVPNVFECTYVRNDIQSKDTRSTERIPSNLDRPNVPGSDIQLTSYPFVHN